MAIIFVLILYLYQVKIDEKYFLVDENNILENGDRVHITLVGKSYCKSHSSRLL